MEITLTQKQQEMYDALNKVVDEMVGNVEFDIIMGLIDEIIEEMMKEEE